jgi:DNA mismatch repair protein MutS
LKDKNLVKTPDLLKNPTPMVKQYRELKQQHPGALLFFRLGDFYELFFEDAIIGARELQITLTARHKDSGDPIPMCGVPHHSAANYIAKLVRKGHRVAICEQTEEASKTKKLVRREVVRIVTPGTPIDPQLLEPRECVYLAAICAIGDAAGIALLDLSTGEFRATQASGADAWIKISAELESYAPRELLFPASLAALVRSGASSSPKTAPLPLAETTETTTVNSARESSDDVFAGTTLTPLEDWLWQADDCAALLIKQFGSQSLDGYGLKSKTEAIRAAGAALRYAQETQRANAAHVRDIVYFEPQDHLVLDKVTVRNLELVEALGAGGVARSLLDVIDETVTGMGARSLRSWLLRPSVRRGEVEARHGGVAELLSSQVKRDRLRTSLKEVADVERLTGRLNLGSATPRDLNALKRSLDQVPLIRQTLAGAQSSLLEVLVENCDELADVRSLIAGAIKDDPPPRLSDGNVIRGGYSTELDELRAISTDAKQTIAAMETQERTRSGIGTLRIRYNGVFGYFIEVSKANAGRVPPDYERRQTLANAERYSTPELKAWEVKVLGAEDRMTKLEAELFANVVREIGGETSRLQGTARALASLDAIASLAETAARRRYVRPTMHDGDEIEIVQSRHPVIEVFNEEPFVPNNLYLNNSTDRLLIITGPNMGGKSTVLRQAAIICILAQMGSFVPAQKATLPLLDRVWTRVGASDDLARGRSTFMVEMVETAAILHGATARSLVLLDEIGRGTATFDGLSIAWAVAEYLHDSPQHCAKTLFATHYHELTELAERLAGAQNYQITATEREGEVVFLHKLERGRASKSYGIEVARLAGMPPPAVARARDVLQRLERYELDVFAEQGDATSLAAHAVAGAANDNDSLDKAVSRAGRRRAAAQSSLFDLANQGLLDELRAAEVDQMTPEEAKALLGELRKRIV